MRPGPSLDALAGAVSVGVRVSSMRGGVVLASDIPAWDVRVEATSDRVVPIRVSMTCDPALVPVDAMGPLANMGQRLLIESLVDAGRGVEAVPVGFFQVGSWEEQADGVKVEALDLMQVLVEAPASWPSSPPEGATLRSELRRLVEPVGLPVVFEARDRGIPRTFQWGVKREEAVRDLCESYGLAYGVKADGQLHVWEQPSGARVVAAYSAQDLLVEARRKSRDRVANRWVVAGSPSGDEATKWTAVSTNYTGEYDPRLYGIVTDRREFNAATSADAVREAADTYKRNALNAASVRSFGIVFDPRLELGDDIVCNVVHDDGTRESVTGRVVAIDATLDQADAVMRVDVKELYW